MKALVLMSAIVLCGCVWGRDGSSQEAWVRAESERLHLDEAQQKDWRDALLYDFVSNRFAAAEAKVRRLTVSEDKLAELTSDERKAYGRFLRDLKCDRDGLRARLVIEEAKMDAAQRSRLAAFTRYRDEFRLRGAVRAAPVAPAAVSEKAVAAPTVSEPKSSVLAAIMAEAGIRIAPAK